MKTFAPLFVSCCALLLDACAAPAPAPVPVQSRNNPQYVVDSAPRYSYNGCADCGTVQSVGERQVDGNKPNIAGGVIGAIIGGVVGHQFGSGSGNTAATVGGAVVGGAVGSQVRKDRGYRVYDMSIRMDSGEYRNVTVAATGGLRDGSRVRISGDHVTPI